MAENSDKIIKHPDVYCTRSTNGDEKFNTINCELPYKIIIDIHMHIMSGHCTPLPLLWNRIPMGKWFKPGTPTIDKAGKISGKIPDIPGVRKLAVTGTLGRVSPLSTRDIGKLVIQKNEDSYHKYMHELDGFVLRSKLLTPMIVMPMDMEYAHLDGYRGHQIYYKVAQRECYEDTYWDANELNGFPRQKTIITFLPPNPAWIEDAPPSLTAELREMRQTAMAIEKRKYSTEKGPFFFFFERATGDDERNRNRRELNWLNSGEVKIYSKWAEQEKDIRKVAVANPWRLLPMFHYDPRRWKGQSLSELENNLAQTSKNKNGGIYIGIKLYTNLGYKPDDPKLRNLAGLYSLCAANNIPVLCHCTPGGFWTHEREFYLDYEKDENITREYRRTLLPDKATDFFKEKFPHPAAWENVVKKNPALKLCLAHFGGDKQWKAWEDSAWVQKILELILNNDNVYTDISCLYLKNFEKQFRGMLLEQKKKGTIDKILDKILFGTDWYMSLMDSYDYMTHCHDSKKILDRLSQDRELDLQMDLWDQLTCVNPMNFLGLKDISDKIKEGLTNQLNSFEDEDLDHVIKAQFDILTPTDKTEEDDELTDLGEGDTGSKLDPIKNKIEDGYNILKNIEI